MHNQTDYQSEFKSVKLRTSKYNLKTNKPVEIFIKIEMLEKFIMNLP